VSRLWAKKGWSTMAGSDRVQKHTGNRRCISLPWLVVLAALLMFLLATPGASAQAPPSEQCSQCHGGSGMSKALPNGEKLEVFVDPSAFSSSVHGKKLICSDCHTGYMGYPHPKRDIASLRDYTIAQYEVCKNCHFANYNKTLDSIHYDLLVKGNRKAPVCTDCHSAHNVTPPGRPRSHISQTCSTCHTAVYNEYGKSVHGRALVEEENADVPACTDCHGVHNILNSKTPDFHTDSTELCSNCHTNKAMMDKYGISTRVVQTYLNDFHGTTLTLRKRQSTDAWTDKAVCIDCHGTHNISRVDAPDSPVMKANLVKTCGKCHADAGDNFPAAWLSHYEPSPGKAPLVYFVKLFYTLLIPFMVVGLSIHIGVNLWRVITHR